MKSKMRHLSRILTVVSIGLFAVSPNLNRAMAQSGAAAKVTTKAAAEKVAKAIASEGFGTFVGTAVDLATLAQQTHATIDQDRSCVIILENELGIDLVKPKFYCFSGGLTGVPLVIAADPKDGSSKSVGVIGAKKTAGTATGAVGVVTYEVEGSDFRIAICYSVPYDYGSYENWFKFQIVSKNTPIDKALYQDMYYNYHQKTLGDIAAADGGYAEWVNGYHMSGTMGTSGNCELRLVLKPMKK
ncbi:MAG: hypothetical protein AAF585_20600 [Verrucomicrobiota bacterium]